MVQISLFFSAQNLAREIYSGHSGVRSAPQRGVPLSPPPSEDKFLATPMDRSWLVTLLKSRARAGELRRLIAHIERLTSVYRSDYLSVNRPCCHRDPRTDGRTDERTARRTDIVMWTDRCSNDVQRHVQAFVRNRRRSRRHRSSWLVDNKLSYSL